MSLKDIQNRLPLKHKAAEKAIKPEITADIFKSEIKKIIKYSKNDNLDLIPGRTVAIIQARMSSTRLPGKVMIKIKSKPMLWYVVNRVRQSRLLDEIIVATSQDKADDKIVEFCVKENIKYFRGSLENVLSRYYFAARDEKADRIIRITSDCPLIDASLIDRGIELFNKSHVDYLSNTLVRSFPRGFDFEIFTFRALESAYMDAKNSYDLEHVTPYIWSHPKRFKLSNFKQDADYSEIRVTVDTIEDFLLIKRLIEKHEAEKLKQAEITEILLKNPKLLTINKDIVQKDYKIKT